MNVLSGPPVDLVLGGNYVSRDISPSTRDPVRLPWDAARLKTDGVITLIMLPIGFMLVILLCHLSSMAASSEKSSLIASSKGAALPSSHQLLCPRTYLTPSGY